MNLSLKKLLVILSLALVQVQSAQASPVFEEEPTTSYSWKRFLGDFVVSIACPFPTQTDPDYQSKVSYIREHGMHNYAWDLLRSNVPVMFGELKNKGVNGLNAAGTYVVDLMFSYPEQGESQEESRLTKYMSYANAQATWQHLRKLGVRGSALGFLDACDDRFTTPISVGAIAFGLVNDDPIVALVGLAASNFRFGRHVFQLGRSMNARTIADHGSQFALMAFGLYMIAHVPGAAALDASGIKTYGQLRDHFNGPACSNDQINGQMYPITRCLSTGRSMQECRDLNTPTSSNDFRVFTVHPTNDANLNPVSTAKFGVQKEVCFMTAMKSGEPVTQTCFHDLANPANHTVTVLPSVTLADAHKGLQPGQSMQYFSVSIKDDSCASFKPVQAKYDLGGKPVCMLLKAPGAEGQQMCFNPANAGEITLRPAPIDLTPMVKDNNPYALVVRDPVETGLVIVPDNAQAVALVADTSRIRDFIKLHKLRQEMEALEQQMGLRTQALPAEHSCPVVQKEVVSIGSYKVVRTEQDPDCVAAAKAQELKKEL
jgi:hypothetical protein